MYFGAGKAGVDVVFREAVFGEEGEAGPDHGGGVKRGDEEG